ncbi:type III pantothenate kinase [Treponema phagedenis]|uniref:Type III pantothenate kinase n=1 Tax=Treponema phagedenis TaxID=162 RepID=A0A0B7GVM8_TREPH|nr:type III pantothenate kinase [Treponema phagedenis]NVP25543.1 type III pantothenate kinase [Treponema phagedenis]QEJ94353.1 type III pantothenate kinase [Treponema phagedenis]QEJ97343.1 type III pantothenate kinase [Treponema phagedenis]QEK01729.1 type III pantothenate kinase [Treponema phagedenis]QEK02463.1 type III pantothenate kinase [Treponema phagedenis]
MHLVVDIGNSNIVIGLFEEERIENEPNCVKTWRLYTNILRTADEYTTIIRSLLRDDNIDISSVHFSLLSSVVPPLTLVFSQVLINLTGIKPAVLAHDVYDKLPIAIPETARYTIGTDIIANAVGAYTFYKKACIVIDFGTALTFTAVDSQGSIQGVAIAPGLQTAAKALVTQTAQLPSVPLEIPHSSLGKNTVHAIQSGIVLGYSSLVEGMIVRMKKELGTDCLVVATGGLSGVLENAENLFTKIDQKLTLKGLSYIAAILNEK